MSHYTKLPGVPDSSDAKPGMAWYAGSYATETGVYGKTCGTCGWRGYYRLAEKKHRNKKTGVEEHRSFLHGGCEMYRKLSAGRHGPAVDTRWAACRHYEEKKR